MSDKRKRSVEDPERKRAANRRLYLENLESRRERQRNKYTADRSAGASQRSSSRARKAGAFIEHVDYALVWNRDNWLCKLCDQPIDSTLRFPHGMSKSVDHIISFKNGGLHEYTNVQAAHLVCNQRKHSK